MKNKIIFDPIHKYIEIHPILQKIIDTPEFQRLRNIKQLGACYYIFPGASHNRFEHSIGVSHLSGQLITQLKTNQPELNISDRQVLLIQIAGLVHDLGHACYSHFFDNLFLKGKLDKTNKFIQHEYRSGIMFKEIVAKYKIDVSPQECDLIIDYINPGENNQGFMYDIVSNKKSGLDCDKFDYIVRDTTNLGLAYSFDYSRLINQARVIDDHITFPEKVNFNIYDLYHTRYRLHKEIYTHPAVHQIELMLLDILNLVDEELNISQGITNSHKFMQYTDNLIDIIYFHPSHSENMLKAKEIIYKIKTRNLYKVVGNTHIYGTKKFEIEDFCKNGINQEDITMLQFSLDYSKGYENPVDNVKFYRINEDGYDLFSFDKNNVSQLLPSTFKETYLRLFCKNEAKVDLTKNVFSEVISNSTIV
jgi:HD superfamily phosphohydrolase